MSQDAKVITGIGIATLLIIIAGAFFLSNGASSTSSSSTDGTSNSAVDSSKASEVKLVPAGSFQTGPKDAPVTLVEFGDFQCPGCGAMYPVVKQLQSQYGKKMNLVFRNFPLVTLHQNAKLAAQAAVAASLQNKFWQMHDILYDKQTDWAEGNNAMSFIDGYAKQIGLNVTTFDQDINSKGVIDKVNNDMADGNSLQVNGTPTFYINQHKYLGQYDFSDLKAAIDAALKKS